MKKIIAALALFSVAFSAQAQVQKTLVKTFNLNGARQVMVDLKNATVIIKKSSDPVMRIETSVNLKNGNEALYDQLSKQGRYDLALSSATPATLTNKPREIVKVSGANLDETISYVVTAPDDVDVQDSNTLAFSKKKGKGKAKPKAKAKPAAATATKPAATATKTVSATKPAATKPAPAAAK